MRTASIRMAVSPLFTFIFSLFTSPVGRANINERNEIMKFLAGGEGLRVAKPAPTPPAPPTLARFHPDDIVGAYPCGPLSVSFPQAVSPLFTFHFSLFTSARTAIRSLLEV